MPKVVFGLEQQFSDFRSKDIAYKFTIENHGVVPINLVSITPRIPETVQLIEAKNPSLVASAAKCAELCSELTQALRDLLFTDVKELRTKITSLEIENLKEIVGSKDLSSWFRVSIRLFGGSLAKQMEMKRLKTDALFFKIENRDHAETAFTTFLSTRPDNDLVKNLFQAKMSQLQDLERAIANNGASGALAIIEPDSFFAITYILKFPRSIADSTRYNIHIEAAYAEGDHKERHVGQASTSLIISPRPDVLTAIAIVSSLAGLAVRLAAKTPADFYAQLFNTMTKTGDAITCIIAAAVFVNIYEFSNLADRFKMNISWRSAMLIGFLSGILGDHILGAIKGFVLNQ